MLVACVVLSFYYFWNPGRQSAATLSTASARSASFAPVLNDIARKETVFNTDFVSAGFGGMRNIGTGTINITGVTGSVTKALLYWHGPTNSNDLTANASVNFAGTDIVGVNIGLSGDNNWGFINSHAYRADVTPLVTGNGAYQLSNFRKPGVEINGASLIVFFNDGNNGNNRDVVIFDGNDSNQTNPFDAQGWNVSLAGINYSGGNANIELHVSDGQAFLDNALIVNGTQTLAPTGAIFQGQTVPNGASAASTNGGLWDIRSFNVTGSLTPGLNTLTLTSGVTSDLLSLIVTLIDLPAGAAPPDPGPLGTDLAVTLSAAPNPVLSSDTLTYTIGVANVGSSPASSVSLSITPPPVALFNNLVSPSGWSCTVPPVGQTGTINCSKSSVGAGANEIFTLTVGIDCSVIDGSTIILSASLTTTNTDTNPSNNTATIGVTVRNIASQAILTIAGGKSEMSFGTVPAARQLVPNPPSDTMTIQNPGCAPVLLGFSINRTGNDVAAGRIVDTDDSTLFPIRVINDDGTETPLSIGPGSPAFIIPGGQTRRFRVQFNPLIPILAGRTDSLFANQVLPDVITSQLTINSQSGSVFVINLTGRISTPMKMTHPTDSSLEPLIVFTRAGNEFTVECTTHDSNLDLYLARYQFLDQGENPVGLPIDLELTQPIAQRGLVRGQSFTIVQRFEGASSRPQINKVRVTLFDRETNVTTAPAILGATEPALASVSAASFRSAALASESIVSGFGNNLAPGSQASAAEPLPTTLAGVRVRVRDGAGTDRDAPLFFVSPGQINYQIPAGTMVGAATVTVFRENQTVAREAVQIAAASPGLFAANANGQGVAAAVALRIGMGGALQYEAVSQYDAVQSRFITRPLDFGFEGDQLYLVLFGTGIRHQQDSSNVIVKFGSVESKAIYAGPQGGFVGLDQINVSVPRNLAGRGELDVVVIVDGRASNTVKINFGGSPSSALETGTGAFISADQDAQIRSSERDASPILLMPILRIPDSDQSRQESQSKTRQSNKAKEQ
jgi:uncharacterized protein (TIGR03437 family)